MKVIYLSRHLIRSGDRLRLQDVPEGELFNFEFADGKVDYRYICFCEDGYAYDHLSSPAFDGKASNHRQLQTIGEVEAWVIII